MFQQNLLFEHDENSLKEYLQGKTGKRISLVITDNSTSMLSLRSKNRCLFLRLHKMFLSADKTVLDEIAGFMKNTKVKTPGVRDFIRQNKNRLKKVTPRKINIQMQGECHDLRDMYCSINEEYFNGRVSALITWGTKRPLRAAARRTLGSYSSYNRLIRINPQLDSRSVPKFFLEFIVYHEMLHADIGLKMKNGRRLYHDGEFKKREKMFKNYKRAIDWENKRW